MLYSGTVFVVSLFPYYSNYHLFLLFLPLLSQLFFVSFHGSIFLLECCKTPSITHDLEPVLRSITVLVLLLMLSGSVAACVLPIEEGPVNI